MFHERSHRNKQGMQCDCSMSDCSGNDTDQRAGNGCYFITSKASEELCVPI